MSMNVHNSHYKLGQTAALHSRIIKWQNVWGPEQFMQKIMVVMVDFFFQKKKKLLDLMLMNLLLFKIIQTMIVASHATKT